MGSQATDMSDLELLDIAVAAASAAAAVIAERSAGRGSLEWREKSPADFVSEVDLAAESRIRQVIDRLAPGATVAGEEGSPDLYAAPGVIFVADPLDGTTNFLHGYPAYAVSIGVVRDGRLAAGVVHDVARGGIYTAAAGHGAWCDGEQLRVSSIDRPDRALIGTGIPFKRPGELERYLPQMNRVARQTAGVRRAGSAALDLVDVACGHFEAFWELSLAPWDVAAGILLIREAGGLVTDLAGSDAAVAHGPIVAGNPAMHRWLLEQLIEADAERAAGAVPNVGATAGMPASLASRAIPPAPPSGSPARPGRADRPVRDRLVECVPNFSEGRRPEVVAAIARAISSVEGASVLDVSSDYWHNRSVVTFVATPESAAAAALEGIRQAARLVDLRSHEGCHPRLGAADVVPFVPLEGTTMAECVAIARELGERVGRELELPVYLYEHAATRPERRNLADVRRGGFEGLRDLIGRDPARDPDFGPARLHPSAGAVVIGARDFLVAFNIHLGPASNLAVAKAVARAVRESSGGLPAVKALGMVVNGQAQLSMNLVDITLTPVHVAFQRVREEAEARGVTVTWSELVGLMPERAIQDAGADALRLRDFSAARLLEVRLRELRES